MFKVLVLALLVVGLIGGVGWALAANAAPKQLPNHYKTERIKHGDIDVTVTAMGTVTPFKTVMVGAQISGLVKEVRKHPNDVVKKGEVLALLDTDLLESERRSAEVRLNQTQAALQVLIVERKNFDLRELRLKSTLARRRILVERSHATLELATKNRERFQQLVGKSAINQAELDIRVLEEKNAERDERLAALDVDDAQTDEKQIEIDRGQLQAKEEHARADVLQAEAALERANTNLRYATIQSPIDGVVLEQLIDVGQTIAAYFQTPTLFKIASELGQIRVDAHIDEADIGRVRPEQTVQFEVDAYRGESFSGRIYKICLQSESKSNLVTYLTLIDAPNPTDAGHPLGKLMPGMTTNLKLILQHRDNALLLPSAALRFVPAGIDADGPAVHIDDESKRIGTHATVYVQNSDGEAEARSVQLGENDGVNFEVLSGSLREGDAVITGQKNDGLSLEAELQ
jgi:HlyD family secretion protein